MKIPSKKVVALFCLIVLVVAGAVLCHRPDPVEKSAYIMGTLVRVRAWGAGADRAVPEALERLSALEQALSANLEDSDVARVNRAGGRGVSVSSATGDLLGEALRFAGLSGGAFDPTVGALVDLWGIGTEQARVPGDEEILSALERVDWHGVRLFDGNEVRLEAGQQLDLGGIAKGYAADVLRDQLKREGIRSGLIDLGGNILVFGENPRGGKWRIGVQDPIQSRGGVLGVVELREGSVVTSGTYERFFERDGVRYHHILDPATGRPARSGLLAVTVVSPGSLEGDALTTALFVMGLDLGIALVNGLEGVEALFVTEDGRVVLSPGLEGRFTLQGEGYRLETR